MTVAARNFYSVMYFLLKRSSKNKPVRVGTGTGLRALSVSGWGHQYRINDVDHAVGAINVGLGDVNVSIELDTALGADL